MHLATNGDRARAQTANAECTPGYLICTRRMGPASGNRDSDLDGLLEGFTGVLTLVFDRKLVFFLIAFLLLGRPA